MPSDPLQPNDPGGGAAPGPPRLGYNPGRRAPTRAAHGKAIFLCVGLVLLIGALSLASLARQVNRDPRSVNFGNRVFEAGRSAKVAKRIANSGPILFPDLVAGDGREKDLYLNHLGGNRFVAFRATAGKADRTCTLRWERQRRVFTDPCDQREYPEDGTGLVRYATVVDRKGVVTVDLNSPKPPASSATRASVVPAPPSAAG